MVRMKREGLVVAYERFFITSLCEQSVAAIVQAFGVLRTNHKRPIVACDRLRVAPEAPQVP